MLLWQGMSDTAKLWVSTWLVCLLCHPLAMPCRAMQGGIHPDFTGDTYLQLLAVAKGAAPDIHVHAFRCSKQWLSMF